MSIGSRIKEARKHRSLTQEELALSIGVTKGAIANYENEVSVPKIDLLIKLMQTLDVDANYLYQDDVQMLNKKGLTTIPDDETSAFTDTDLIMRLCQLTPEDTNRVRDFVQGLIAARKEPPARKE